MPAGFDSVYLVVIEAVIVSDLVPERVFDLSIKTRLVVRYGHDGIFKQRDLVRQHEVVACPALRQRDAFVEPQEKLITPQAKFVRLLRCRLVSIGDHNVVQVLDISLRHLAHGAGDELVKGLVGDIVHGIKYRASITQLSTLPIYDSTISVYNTT